MINRKWIDYIIIKKSGLFDAHYYLQEYKDVLLADIDPLMHFITIGWKEGRNPSQSFDTNYYLDMNPDVNQFGINPLVHYIRHGEKEGRQIKADAYHALGLHVDQGNYLPKVTVIVPNYNHAPFLEERLESIYNQTYKNIEVILLDDGSSDDSLSILKRYAEKYPEITRCSFNLTNTGSPFAQWKNGISLAEGDLIWIAESDDFCENNFLETMVPYFSDDSILLSYAHTIFVDRSGKKHPFAFETYVSQIDKKKWGSSYVETAHNEVNSAMGLLNTIPNVSSVVFRKIDGDFPLFNDPDWLKMKVCGDWLFYLNLMRGGRVAYCRETHDYYRIHQAGTSKKAQTQDIYYQEHEKVGCAIAGLYNVPENLLSRLHQRIKDFYFKNVENGNNENFSACFDINKVIESKKNRKPNLLIATYGFAFGGGEIFPIRLANAMKDNGISVTLFNGGYEPMQLGVRKMLYSEIPVVNNARSFDIGSMLKEFGIEIIHTHHASMENLFAAARSHDSFGIKHVSTMHGMYEMMDKFIPNTKEIQRSVDHWFYTAEKNIAPFKKRGLFTEEKFTKIDNGMQIPVFHKVDLTPLGITSDSFTACLASRALPEKGWKEAIEAIGIAREMTKKDLHLILIGEGPMYTQLKTQELPAYVHLLGFKANLDDYLASSQLGLLPSYFKGESFPLVLIECFMAEIPVIATRIGEIERMITTDDQRIGGALIDLHDGKVNPNELADAIEIMVLDRDCYDRSVEAVRLLKKRFDINTVAKQYISVYQRILE